MLLLMFAVCRARLGYWQGARLKICRLPGARIIRGRDFWRTRSKHSVTEPRGDRGCGKTLAGAKGAIFASLRSGRSSIPAENSTDKRSGLLWSINSVVITMKIGDASGDDRRYGGAAKLRAVKGRITAPGFRTRHLERPGKFRIQDC